MWEVRPRPPCTSPSCTLPHRLSPGGCAELSTATDNAGGAAPAFDRSLARARGAAPHLAPGTLADRADGSDESRRRRGGRFGNVGRCSDDTCVDGQLCSGIGGLGERNADGVVGAEVVAELPHAWSQGCGGEPGQGESGERACALPWGECTAEDGSAQGVGDLGVDEGGAAEVFVAPAVGVECTGDELDDDTSIDDRPRLSTDRAAVPNFWSRT